MKKIYSKTKPDVLICIIFNSEDMLDQETSGLDLTPEEDFIQVRSLKASAGKIFKAHKHIPQLRLTNLTQESLIIMQGSIKTKIYDLDDVVIDTFILRSGDCLVALRGGHSFKILEDNTFFYELKNGPYNGLEKDKIFIGEENV